MSKTATDSTTLGQCPNCGTVIPTHSMLIEYESEDGQPEVWAECPECQEVVHPE